MSLVTYEEVRPWASIIRTKVANREMPPWHLDTTVGIQDLANDISLTQGEITTILDWVDSGSPRGDPAVRLAPPDLPATRDWELQSDLGPPDLVLRPSPQTIAAHGADQWVRSESVAIASQDRFIRALEVRPSPDGRGITHHVVLLTESGGQQRLLTEWGAGKTAELMPPRTGRRFPANSRIIWDVHFVPNGTAASSIQPEVAIWFHPVDVPPAFESQLQLFRAEPPTSPARGASIDIPPHSVSTISGVHRLRSAARIESFQAHMHLRGREMTMEVIFPDGRRKILSRIDRYDHSWQISYHYNEDSAPLLPPGSSLVITAVHDNTTANPRNPDPDQWVGFGRRTVDEMAHAWVGITYLDDTEYLRLLADQPASIQDRSR